MASHSGFNFYNSTLEQNLYENLIVEAIKQYAHDMYYLPRTVINSDDVLNENESISFNAALPVEAYIKNTDSFEGDGQLLSKFAGFEARDQMTLNMSRRSFNEFVKPTTSASRPIEGDIIFIPMLNVAYQIKYTKTDSIFYVHGKLNMFEIVLDLFENNGERFNTGLSLIDSLYPQRSNVNDPGYDIDDDDRDAGNDTFQDEANTILDLSESDPFTEGQI